MEANYGKILGLSTLNLAVFFAMFECWHQFREHSGWAASGWFALLIAAWVGCVLLTKFTNKLAGRNA